MEKTETERELKIKASHLFAIPICQVKVEQDTDKLKECQEFISSHNQEPSGQGNTQYRVLDKYPEIDHILLEAFEEFSGQFLDYESDFKITTSWITKTTKGVSSSYHNHKNSFFSGVYYFDEYDKESANIDFLNPLSDLSSFMLDPGRLTPVNANYVSFPPGDKTVIFFPSYLVHRVGIHKSDKPRYSLAFNIVPTGDYGSGDSMHKASWINT
tara:strand:+ start:1495 stop:2133 length:639 start_codon:yes stop_codon:yes gene_type:complete